jgi:acyl-CoA thioester hydrolase
VKKLASSQVRVRYAEADPMGVAYHANYFAWFEVGRSDLLRGLGFTFRELQQRGFYFPIIETQARFRRSARYDDLLDIRTAVAFVRGVRVGFNYEVHRDEDADNPLATATTVHATVDSEGRPRRLPADLHRMLA